MRTGPLIPSHSLLAFAWLTLPLVALACGPTLRPESAQPQSPEATSNNTIAEKSPSQPLAPDANAAAQQDARRRARAWLALVDEGQYGESWDTAAGLFQSATSKEQWSAAVQRVREPLGHLSTRRFRAAEFRTALTGAPEGKYFVVHYDSAFAKKPSTREVLTLKQAPDASWKVAGYFVE